MSVLILFLHLPLYPLHVNSNNSKIVTPRLWVIHLRHVLHDRVLMQCRVATRKDEPSLKMVELKYEGSYSLSRCTFMRRKLMLIN